MSKKLVDLMHTDEGREELCRLALEAPDELESLLRSEIDNLINRLPENKQATLKALQVDIDLMKLEITDPLDRCVAIMHIIAEKAAETKVSCEQIDSILAGDTPESGASDPLDINFK